MRAAFKFGALTADGPHVVAMAKIAGWPRERKCARAAKLASGQRLAALGNCTRAEVRAMQQFCLAGKTLSTDPCRQASQDPCRQASQDPCRQASQDSRRLGCDSSIGCDRPVHRTQTAALYWQCHCSRRQQHWRQECEGHLA
eukprot:366476-Chlamydomonas_euryale.AAC.11